MKREGRETPAQHHTMSGAWSSFHAVASERTRVASVGEVRSALM